MSDRERGQRRVLWPAERPKAFIDAVVAIAMTLLILPLMDSVTGAEAPRDAWSWLRGHEDQLLSFALSFVVIALFWLTHHRLFSGVEKVSSGFLWLTFAWLITIVWLPVPTAMSGHLSAEDGVVKTLYIGSMILTSAIVLLQRLFLRRNPEMHTFTDAQLRAGIAVDLSLVLLFGIALVLGVTIPPLGYLPMLLLFLSGPVQALFRRLLRVPRPRAV